MWDIPHCSHFENSDLEGAEGLDERGRGLCVDLEREIVSYGHSLFLKCTQSCWRNILCLILKFWHKQKNAILVPPSLPGSLSFHFRRLETGVLDLSGQEYV